VEEVANILNSFVDEVANILMRWRTYVTYLPLLLDMQLQLGMLPLISYLDVNKNSNIVENITSSELSIRVHKTMNRIGRNCRSLALQ